MVPGSARLLIALACAVFPATSLLAHHSFAPKYDPAKPVRVSGVVGSVSLQNPHSYFEIDAGAKTWRVETEGVAAAKAAGLSTDNLKQGVKVSVSGWLARDGSPSLGLHTITIGGKTLTMRRSAR
jgi:hypothetical protein